MRPSTLGLIGTLALGLLVGSLAADAQPPAPVYRIGRLSSGHPPLGADPNAEAFRQGLRDLGWIEGQNIAFEHRYAEEQAVRLPALAAELVQLPVHVIFAVGAAAIRAAQLATPTLPIVMLVGGIRSVRGSSRASRARVATSPASPPSRRSSAPNGSPY
jgi:ABC-type uncharacterized transport system substrate-binding protein